MFELAKARCFDERALGKGSNRDKLLISYRNHLPSSQGLPERILSQNQKKQKQEFIFQS